MSQYFPRFSRRWRFVFNHYLPTVILLLCPLFFRWHVIKVRADVALCGVSTSCCYSHVWGQCWLRCIHNVCPLWEFSPVFRWSAQFIPSGRKYTTDLTLCPRSHLSPWRLWRWREIDAHSNLSKNDGGLRVWLWCGSFLIQSAATFQGGGMTCPLAIQQLEEEHGNKMHSR